MNPTGGSIFKVETLGLEEYVKKALYDLGIPEVTPSRYKKSILQLVLKGYRQAGMSAATGSALTKKYFPDKPPNLTLKVWVCELLNNKYCPNCDEVLSKEYFNKNKAATLGKQSYCKPCQYLAEKPFSAEKTARYRAAKLLRCPSWADLDKIKDIYNKVPKGMVVDHIVPLQGEKVSGHHVDYNLQYLSVQDNASKGNKFSGL